jgi:hypothetical protein
MCFSAEASFVVGAGLLPAAGYCLKSAIRKDRRYVPLAVVPLVFSIQQMCEGVVWVGLDRGDQGMVRAAALTFLFFALAFWPVWMPLSVLSLAPSPRVRRLIMLTIAAGVAHGALLMVPLTTQPAEASIASAAGHVIRYDLITLPALSSLPPALAHIVYLAIIALPLIAIRSKELHVFAGLIIVSAVVAHFAYWYAFVSVWCLFAAVLSAYLCRFFWRMRHPTAHRPLVAAVVAASAS